MRSTGTGPALRWAAGAGSILGIGVGSPAGRNGGADGAAVGLALCASPRTCAPPSPGSWQPPAMWSPRSSSTGSADTSTSRSSTSECRPGGGVGGGAMGVGVSLSPRFPSTPGEAKTSALDFPEGPGEVVPGSGGAKALSPLQSLPHDAEAQLSQGGPAGQGPVCQAWPQLRGEALPHRPGGHHQVRAVHSRWLPGAPAHPWGPSATP